MSEYLVAQGVAVLAYDKRGGGSSSGWWADAGVEALAADARCALDVLRAHRCVAPAAVGVFGHSEGGWVAMRVGAQEPTLAHVVLNSCPAVSLLEAEQFTLARSGLRPADARAAGDLLRAIPASARGVGQLEEAQQLVESARNEPWFGMLEDGGLTLNREGWAQIRAWSSYLNRLREWIASS